MKHNRKIIYEGERMQAVPLSMVSASRKPEAMPRLWKQEMEERNQGAKDMIEIEYPAIRTLHDTVRTKEIAVEELKNARHRLYEEIAKLDNKIEELQA
ncbi:hypothetical protein M0R72_20320 [Candidatus Pacearchaeota archaeon]|jgi:hypothetical protein|nr:hypothetical protein [Candidatus Pacearchaeota archaeon]